MKRLTTLALIVGLCTVVGLFLSSGPEDVAAAVASAGWGALIVVLARVFAVGWAGLGWFVIFPKADRPSLWDCVVLRFVREGINTLLPVAQVGGDLVGARLLTRRGLGGGLAGASMFVDLMTQAVTQFLFTIAGLAALIWIAGDGPVVRTVAGGLVLAAPALAIFFVIQRRGGHLLVQRLLNRFAAGRDWRALGAVDVLYEGLRRLYGAPMRVGAGMGVHLVGWLIGTVEVYVALHFMGYPVTILEAIVIESLAQAVRGAAFAIPGALGAQEGGLIALCAIFDIPAEVALALSLVKRLADLLVGVPGLFAWHALEGRPGNDPERGGAVADSHRGDRQTAPYEAANEPGQAPSSPSAQADGGRLAEKGSLAETGRLRKCA
ncbi:MULTISPECIES: flippase-like domain-containing protein [unclassified Methylobacterium]|uniref:flippase-like domain-containing protein n=1 Tax=unclassified Methylobacterium TaxID=2615210 RepID=UPI0009EC70C9|nr:MULTISPECIES: flippase-like domain-containing protein [unclassified Methylobacterium]